MGGSMGPLEILNFALVFFGGLSCGEGSQIPAFPGFCIGFRGVEPVLTGLEFSDHAPSAACQAPLAEVINIKGPSKHAETLP